MEALLNEKPRFHAQFEADGSVISNSVSHGIDQIILDWIVQNVPPGARTLETGCGYSSIAFIAALAKHTVVSPIQCEHESVRKWCIDHEIALHNVSFVAGRSQTILPTLKMDPLDVILIDGDHAFPTPFLDWAFTADYLRRGGMLIVDDTDLVTGTILESFLLMDREAWSLEAAMGKTAFFRKRAEGSVTQPEWHGLQPFAAKRERSLIRRVRRKLAKLLAHPDDALFWH